MPVHRQSEPYELRATTKSRLGAEATLSVNGVARPSSAWLWRSDASQCTTTRSRLFTLPYDRSVSPAPLTSFSLQSVAEGLRNVVVGAELEADHLTDHEQQRSSPNRPRLSFGLAVASSLPGREAAAFWLNTDRERYAGMVGLSGRQPSAYHGRRPHQVPKQLLPLRVRHAARALQTL